MRTNNIAIVGPNNGQQMIEDLDLEAGQQPKDNIVNANGQAVSLPPPPPVQPPMNDQNNNNGAVAAPSAPFVMEMPAWLITMGQRIRQCGQWIRKGFIISSYPKIISYYY